MPDDNTYSASLRKHGTRICQKMWTRKSSKSNGGKDDAQPQSSRRREGSRPRSDSKTSSTLKKSSSSRGDDRDRGIEPISTGYTSAPQGPYSYTAEPSVASSYATAAANPTDYQTTSPDLIRSNSFPDQTYNTKYRRDKSTYEEQYDGKERRSDRSRSKDQAKKSRGSDDRDDDKRERRERRERRRDLEKEKDRGISRSDSYPQSTTRGPGDFDAQIHGSGFTQFPGQYDDSFTGGPGARPQHNEPLSSHVPDQFPGQFPSQSSGPYRPPLAKNEGGPGLASEYYGDAGESVHQQPGVRPQPPPLIIGAEPHLQPASAVEAPPPEPSSLGQIGAAASFYNSTEDFGPGSAPIRPTQNPSSSQPTPSGFPAAAPLAGAVAAGMMASNATFSQSSGHFSEQTSYQSRPSTSAPSIAPSNTTYHSTTTNVNPIVGAASAAAAGTAAGYVLGHQSSSSGRPPQEYMMSGALNSSAQSSYQSRPPTSMPPTTAQHSSSSANPVLGAVGAAAAGAAAGYFLGNHSSSSNQVHTQTSTNGGFQGRPSNSRPPRPQSYHQDSQSFVANVQGSYNHGDSHATESPHHSSNAPLYAAGLAGAAGLAASSMHNGHHSPPHGNFSYSHGSMAQKHHEKYHQRQGPLDKFVDFWRDPYAVGRYEEYTEYIGVCRYCFSPGSSARDAPRKHHYGRRKSSYERLNAAARVGKDYRRYSSSSESGRERKNKNKSWLAAGLGAYGLGKIGRSLFAANHGFDDTYSVQSGKPLGSSSKERRSYSQAGHTNMPGSYPAAGVPVETVTMADGRVFAKDGNRIVGEVSWSGTHDQAFRSRSRSRDRKSTHIAAASEAAVGGLALATAARRHSRSPKRESRHHLQDSQSDYVEFRRDGRREHGHSTSPHHQGTLVEVRRKDNRQEYHHSTSPHHHKKKTKKSKGFFSFSNSSTSSEDNSLAFGAELERRKSKKDLRSRKQSSDKTDAAILGLGAAATALALQQSHHNGKGKQRTDAPGLTNPNQIYAADGRKDSHGRYGHHHGPDDDGWESASDDDHSSVNSMLAYGISSRSSRESLRSDYSGTEKWSWRWGGEKKKSKKPRHHDSSVSVLGAVTAAAVGGVVAAEGIHRYNERNHPVSSNAGLPPMQHVVPYSTSDPTAFDVTRHSSTISLSQPLTTVRPSPLPLQQPQPVSQVSTSVLKSIAPLDHSYSAPVGPIVYNQASHQPQIAPSRVPPSSIPPFGHDAMPGSFPLQPNIPHDTQPVIKEISPRRRDSTPPDLSKVSKDVVRSSTGIDISPSVRFNLTQEDEDRERREKRRWKKEEKARRAEAERLEQLQQAEMDEAYRATKRASQTAASPQRMVSDKYESPPRDESNDHEIRSQRRSRSDSHPSAVDQTASWVAPALAGATGAAVGVAIIHEIEPKRKDRPLTDHADRHEDVGRREDYHHDEKYQEVYERVMHDHEGLDKISRKELSKEERRAEKRRAKVAQEVARRVSRTPSPVHESYSEFFQPPPGTFEAAREAEEEKKSYGVPDADNQIFRYRDPRDMIAEAERAAPKDVYNAQGDLMDSSRMMPWRVAPMLNLVEPTPPGSIVGSVRGDASPVIQPQTQPEIVSITEIEEPAKEVPKPRSASRVRFGDNETQEYEVITPDGHREEFIESTYKPLKRTYAEDGTKPTARPQSQGEIAPKDPPRHEHMPGEFGDDIDFTATVAAGLEDSGFPSSIVVDDPNFRRRDSPPGSDNERAGSDKRDIGSVYQSPFYETVTDLGAHSRRVKDEPKRDEAKFPNVMDFLVEEPTEHMVEIKPKGDAKSKDTSKKRSLRDVIGLVGAAGAAGALSGATSSSPPRKPVEARSIVLESAGEDSKHIRRDSTTSPKPRTLKRVDLDLEAKVLDIATSPKRRDLKHKEVDLEPKVSESTASDIRVATDHFYDAPDVPRPRPESIFSIPESTLDDFATISRSGPEGIPLPIGDDGDLEAPGFNDDARIDASEARQLRDLGEHDIADALQQKEIVSGDAYEGSKRSRKKSKRRSMTDFDDLASVASAPTVVDRSPEPNGESKGKSKKERRGGLFGIFSKSTENVSGKRSSKGKTKTDDFYDYEEPDNKARKSKGRRSTGDDFDDDVQSRASEPAPTTEFEEVGKKGKKGKERRSNRDDYYEEDTYSRASEPAPALEYEESGKKSKRSKDRKASQGDYDDDTLSRASEPVPTVPGLDDAEEDVRSRRKRDKDEKRKSRKDDKANGELGRVTQELPAKVHLPAFPAASFSITLERTLLMELGKVQNDDRDVIALEDKEYRRRNKSLPRDLDQDQSFLGERQERKKPPDDEHGGSWSGNRDPHQRSKDVEAALHALTEGRPATPESDSSQREVQSTPSHRRRVSMLQSSDSPNATSTPSPTAIPISFRMGSRPSSLQFTRSSPNTPTLAATQPDTPRSRKQRPKSGEIRRSTEIRPLFLVEKHSARQEPVLEDRYPSLPSSHSTSRASSVHDGGDEEDEVDQLVNREHRKGSYHERSLGIDVGHYNEADLLDSQQTTPTATSFREAGEHVIEQPELSYRKERRFSQGDVEREVLAEIPRQRRLSRDEKERRRSESFLKNVAWDQLAGGAAVLKALRDINTPSTPLLESTNTAEKGTRDIHEDRPPAHSHQSQEQLSQGPAFSAGSFDKFDEGRVLHEGVERADVSRVTATTEPLDTQISIQQTESAEATPVAEVIPQVDQELLESWSTPTPSRKGKKGRKGKQAVKKGIFEDITEPVVAKVDEDKDFETETPLAHRDQSPIAPASTYLEKVQPLKPHFSDEKTRSIEEIGQAPTLSKDMPTSVVVATMAAAASALIPDQHLANKTDAIEPSLEAEFQPSAHSKIEKDKKDRRAEDEDWEIVDAPEEGPLPQAEKISPNLPASDRNADFADVHHETAIPTSLQRTISAEPIEEFTPSKRNKKGEEELSVAVPAPEASSQEASLLPDPLVQNTEITSDVVAPKKKDKKGKKGKMEQVAFEDFEETVPVVEEQSREIVQLERPLSPGFLALPEDDDLDLEELSGSKKQPREIVQLKRPLSPRFLALPEGDDLDLEELSESAFSSEHHGSRQGDVPPSHEEAGDIREMQPVSTEPHVPVTPVTEEPSLSVQESEAPKDPRLQSHPLSVGEAARELPVLDPTRHTDSEVAGIERSPFETTLTAPTDDTPIEKVAPSSPQEPTPNAQDDDYFGFAPTKKGKKGKKGRKSQTSTPLDESTTAAEDSKMPMNVLDGEAGEARRALRSAPISMEEQIQDVGTEEWAPSVGKKKGKKGKKSQTVAVSESLDITDQASMDPVGLPKLDTNRTEASETSAIHEEPEVNRSIPATEEVPTEEQALEERAPLSSKKKDKKGKRPSTSFEDVAIIEEPAPSTEALETESSRDLKIIPTPEITQAQEPDTEEWAPSSTKKKGKKSKKNQSFPLPDESTIADEEAAMPLEPSQVELDRDHESPSVQKSTNASEVDQWAPTTSKKKSRKSRKGLDPFDEPTAGLEDTMTPMEILPSNESRDLGSPSLSEAIEAEEAETTAKEANFEELALPSSKKKGKKGSKGKAVALDLEAQPVDESMQEMGMQRGIQSIAPDSRLSNVASGNQQSDFDLASQKDVLQPSVTSESQENLTIIDKEALETANVDPFTLSIEPAEASKTVKTSEPPTPSDDLVSATKTKGRKGKKGKRTSSKVDSPVVDRRQSTGDWMDAALDEPTRFEEPKSTFDGVETAAFEEPERLPEIVSDGAREIKEAQGIGHDRPPTPLENDHRATSISKDTEGEALPEIVSDGARAAKDEPTFDYQRPVTPDASDSSMIFETPSRYPDQPLRETSERPFQRPISSTSQSTHDSFHEADEGQETPRLMPTVLHTLHDVDIPSQSTPLAMAFDPSDIALPLDEPSDFENDAWHEVLGHDLLGQDVETDLDRELAGSEALQRVVTLDGSDGEMATSERSEGEGTSQDADQAATPKVVEAAEDQLPAHVLHQADELLQDEPEERARVVARETVEPVEEPLDRIPTPALQKADELLQGLPEEQARATTTGAVEKPVELLPAPVLKKADELLQGSLEDQAQATIPPLGEEPVDQISTAALKKVDEHLRDSPEQQARAVTPKLVDEPVDRLPAPVLYKADELLQGSPQGEPRGVLTPPIESELQGVNPTVEGVENVRKAMEEPTVERSIIEGTITDEPGLDKGAKHQTYQEPVEGLSNVALDLPSAEAWDGRQLDSERTAAEEIILPTKEYEISSLRRQPHIEDVATLQNLVSASSERIEPTTLQEPDVVPADVFSTQLQVGESTAQEMNLTPTKEIALEAEEPPSFSLKKSKKEKRKSKKAQITDLDEEPKTTVLPNESNQGNPGTFASQISPPASSEQEKPTAPENVLSEQPSLSKEVEFPQEESVSVPTEIAALEEPAPREFESFSLKKSKKDKKKAKKAKVFDWNEPDASSSGQATPGTQSLEASAILPELPKEDLSEDAQLAQTSTDTATEQERGLEQLADPTENVLVPEEEPSSSQKKNEKDKRKLKKAQTTDPDDEPGDASKDMPAPSISQEETHGIAEALPVEEPVKQEPSLPPEEAIMATEQPSTLLDESSFGLKKGKKDKKKAKRAQTFSFNDEPDLPSSGALTPDISREFEPTTTSENLSLDQSNLLEAKSPAQEGDDFSSLKKSKKDKRKSKRAQTSNLDDEPDLASSGVLTPEVSKEIEPSNPSESLTTSQSEFPNEKSIAQEDDDFSTFKQSKNDRKKAKKSKAGDLGRGPQADATKISDSNQGAEPSTILSQDEAFHSGLTDEPPMLERSLSTDFPTASLETLKEEQPEETAPAPEDFTSFSMKKSRKDKKAKRSQTLDWPEEPEATPATLEPSEDPKLFEPPTLQEHKTQVVETVLPEVAVEADEGLGFTSKKKSKKDRKKSKQAGDFTWDDDKGAKGTPGNTVATEVLSAQPQLPDAQDTEPKVQAIDISKGIVEPYSPKVRMIEGLGREMAGREVFDEKQQSVSQPEVSLFEKPTEVLEPSITEEPEIHTTEPISLPDFDKGDLRPDSQVKELPTFENQPIVDPTATKVGDKVPTSEQIPITIHDKEDPSILPRMHELPPDQPVVNRGYGEEALHEPSQEATVTEARDDTSSIEHLPDPVRIINDPSLYSQVQESTPEHSATNRGYGDEVPHEPSGNAITTETMGDLPSAEHAPVPFHGTTEPSRLSPLFELRPEQPFSERDKWILPEPSGETTADAPLDEPASRIEQEGATPLEPQPEILTPPDEPSEFSLKKSKKDKKKSRKAQALAWDEPTEEPVAEGSTSQDISQSASQEHPDFSESANVETLRHEPAHGIAGNDFDEAALEKLSDAVPLLEEPQQPPISLKLPQEPPTSLEEPLEYGLRKSKKDKKKGKKSQSVTWDEAAEAAPKLDNAPSRELQATEENIEPVTEPPVSYITDDTAQKSQEPITPLDEPSEFSSKRSKKDKKKGKKAPAFDWDNTTQAEAPTAVDTLTRAIPAADESSLPLDQTVEPITIVSEEKTLEEPQEVGMSLEEVGEPSEFSLKSKKDKKKGKKTQAVALDDTPETPLAEASPFSQSVDESTTVPGEENRQQTIPADEQPKSVQTELAEIDFPSGKKSKKDKKKSKKTQAFEWTEEPTAESPGVDPFDGKQPQEIFEQTGQLRDVPITETIQGPEEPFEAEISTSKKSKRDKKGKKGKTIDWNEEPPSIIPEGASTSFPTSEGATPLEIEQVSNKASNPEEFEAFSSKKGKKGKKSKRAQEGTWDEQPQETKASEIGPEEIADSVVEKDLQANIAEAAKIATSESEEVDYFSVKTTQDRENSEQATWDEPVQEVEPLKEIYDVPMESNPALGLPKDTSALAPLSEETGGEIFTGKESNKDERKGKNALDEDWEESGKDREFQKDDEDMIMPSAIEGQEGEVVESALPSMREKDAQGNADDMVMPQQTVDMADSAVLQETKHEQDVEDMIMPQEIEREAVDEPATATVSEESEYLPMKKSKKDKRKKKAMEETWDEPVESQLREVDEMAEVQRELDPEVTRIAQSTTAAPTEETEYLSSKKSKKDKKKSKKQAVSWNEPVEEEIKSELVPAEVMEEDVKTKEVDPTTKVLNELGLNKVDIPESSTSKKGDETIKDIKNEEVDPTTQVLNELGLEKVDISEDPTVEIVDQAEVTPSRKGKKGKKNSKGQELSWDEPKEKSTFEGNRNIEVTPSNTKLEVAREDFNNAMPAGDPEVLSKRSKRDKKKSKKAQIDQWEEPILEVGPTSQRVMTPIPEVVVEEPEASKITPVHDEFESQVPKKMSKDEKKIQFLGDLERSLQTEEVTHENETRSHEVSPQANVGEGKVESGIVPDLHKHTGQREQVPSIETLEGRSATPHVGDVIRPPSDLYHQDLDEPVQPREYVAGDDAADFTVTKKRKKPKRMETFDAEANQAREILEEQHVERPTSQHARDAPLHKEAASGQLVRADESLPPLSEIAALLPPIRKRSKKSRKSAGSQHSSENPSMQEEIKRETLESGGGLASMIPQGDFYHPPEPLEATHRVSDERLDKEEPYAYPHHEPVEPHTFPVEQESQEGSVEDSSMYPNATSREIDYQRPLTPPDEVGVSRTKSKKEKRKGKESKMVAEEVDPTPRDNVFEERQAETEYTKPYDVHDTHTIGGAVESLPEEQNFDKAILSNGKGQPLDLPSKKSKRSRKSRNRSPEPVEDEPTFDPKPGVAAGIAAGVALFEGLQRGRSAKNKKDRKSSASVDWDDLNPEEHLAGKVKNRRESIEKGARPEEVARTDIEGPRVLPHKARLTSEDQSLAHDNRDSGVHFDSPILHEQSPITRSSERDSEYQGAEESPQVGLDLQNQTRELHSSTIKNAEQAQTRHLQVDENDSHNISHRSSMAESSDNPLNISIEVDPDYDVSVSRPVGECGHGHGKHHSRHEDRDLGSKRHGEYPHDLDHDALHEPLSTHGESLHETSAERPTQVHSTSRDRSSSLFDSSPSTRDQSSTYDRHYQQSLTHHDDALRETSRDMPIEQARSASYPMEERLTGQSIDEPRQSMQASLFGGPVGINSDQVLSPPRTPVESASSRRRRLNTITEHSPEDALQHKHPREAPEAATAEPAAKSTRRSSTPKTFAQHRVRSPLGASQLAGVAAAAGIAGALSTDKIIAGMSWPPVDDDNQSVDLDKITKQSRETSRNSSGQHDDPSILPIKSKGGRRSLSGASAASGDSIRAYIQSPDHPRSVSGTPPLRRSDRSISGDLRAANKRESAKKAAKPYEDSGEREFLPDAAIASSSTYDPVRDKGKSRSRDMADVYVSLELLSH